MSNVLNTYGEYAKFIFYLLADRPKIESHTIAVYTKSQTIGITRGRIFFRSGYVLRVFEQVDFVVHRIVKYFYELTFEGEPLWWYDSMPHPDVEELQSTHPHHKHIPPDIKHHRVTTTDVSFIRPNLPVLIEEIENLIDRDSKSNLQISNLT
jgi:hypothetical protein